MAQFLSWGDGHDGSPNAISGTVNIYATMTATSGDPTVTTSLSVSAGDQVLLHQTRHASAAGTWEIVKVASTGSGTFEATANLVNSYSTGAQAILIPQYTGGTISGAVTGTSWNGTVGGVIALLSNGDLTVSGSLKVEGVSATTNGPGATGGGFYGGNGGNNATIAKYGEGTIGTSATASSTAANGNGGGAAYPNNGINGGGGGGNGVTGTTGTHYSGAAAGGIGGATSGVAALTTMVFGGGGGGGSVDGVGSVSGGGSGGGIVFIIAKNFTLSGTISLNAGAGGAATYGAGGGGGGGSCLIKTQIAVLGTNKITVAAGAGGTSSNSGHGGAGSVGRIRCDYFTSVSGSTTPTLSSAQDLTLNTIGSGFFNFFSE